jgi:hypothetical protein
MKPSKIRGVKYIAPVSVIAIIIVVAALSFRLPAAGANPPPHDVPNFEGEPVYDTLINISEPVRIISVVDNPQADWVTIFEEDFEDDNWEQQWLNVSQSGEGYKYGTRAMTNTLDPFSSKSAWAVGASPEGKPALDPENDGYPANVNAWLIAGPFDFTNVAKVNLAFEYSFEADIGDIVAVQASADFPNFTGTEKDGGDGGWIPADMDLSSYAGEPSVYFAFTFKSDDSLNVDKKVGLLLDNVKLDVKYSTETHLPYIAYDVVLIPDATPTATITPGDSYYKGFTNNIDPWEAVRWSVGADYELRHSDTCDDNRCGYLNLEVEKSNHYTIVSPKKFSKPYPYTMETKAKIRSPREDMDSYGIIFGASTNGQNCPVSDFTNCFEHYYELRVRYRHTDNSWLEFKLVSVGGHDENNQPIETDLIEWTSVSQDPDTHQEWDVDVKGNGDMIVKISDDEVGRTNDSKFINNPYFGLVVRSGSIGSSEVKFDYFEVK